MSTVQIVQQETKHYPNMAKTYTTLEGKAGKHSAVVSVRHDGPVRVIVQNASHQAWRGLGKEYPNGQAALGAYKTENVRAIIQAAIDAAKEQGAKL